MRRRIALVAVLAVAGAAHLWFWYLPRAHRGRASEHALVLLGQVDGDAAWIAHPHQNLAVAARRVDLERLVDAACRLDPQRRCRPLPRFGPLAVPPASEAVLALDGSLVAFRLHLSIALLARAAGTLAGNPWLAGGAVDGDGAQVQWRDGWWILGRGGHLVVDADRPNQLRELPAVLARIELAGPRLGLAAGGFAVDADEHGLVVASRESGDAAALRGGDGCGVGVAARLEHLPAWLDRGVAVAGGGATLPRLGLLGREQEVAEVVDDLGLLSRGWERRQVGGRLAAASDAATLDLLLEPLSREASLCLDAAALDRGFGEIARTLADLPLLSRADRRRFGAAAEIAASLAPLGRVEWRVAADGRAARLSTESR